MKKQRFWNVDLIELFKLWASDMGTFFLTALMFAAMSLPVVIPMLLLWFLYVTDWHMGP